MQIADIPVPEAYTSSADFRFFMKWADACLSKIQYDTDNLIDLLDPQRCPKDLLWLLCDTYGYKYDDRLTPAFNRFVLLYFMSMIANRGSKLGVTLAAEVNLAQLSLMEYAQENPEYEDRIADTSVPVNSVYVNYNTAKGYVDVVYFAENDPVDACLDYVMPLGMYCFSQSGVRVDAKTKISVDARLTDIDALSIPVGPTHVGHYRRADYASLQGTEVVDGERRYKKRQEVYYRNSVNEGRTTAMIDPGLRSLYTLQISNNEHIVKALVPGTQEEYDPIFSLGYGPQDVSVRYPDNYLKHEDNPVYNLRYDFAQERSITQDVYTMDVNRTKDILNPRPAVNPMMTAMGDAMSMNNTNTKYTKVHEDGSITVEDVTEE